MDTIRCSYCSKYYSKTSADKCLDCQKQFESVLKQMSLKYAGALKKLADR